MTDAERERLRAVMAEFEAGPAAFEHAWDEPGNLTRAEHEAGKVRLLEIADERRLGAAARLDAARDRLAEALPHGVAVVSEYHTAHALARHEGVPVHDPDVDCGFPISRIRWPGLPGFLSEEVSK